MPKKQAPNAFMVYVKDRQRQLEKEGETFTGTPDAVARIGPEWEVSKVIFLGTFLFFFASLWFFAGWIDFRLCYSVVNLEIIEDMKE